MKKLIISILILGFFFSNRSFAGDLISDEDFQDLFQKNWQVFNHYSLKITHDIYIDPLEYKYDFKLYGPYDFSVEISQKFDDEINVGTLMIVQGSVILVNGFKKNIVPLDELDIASLQLQMFQKLIIQSFPNGPDSIATDAGIDIRDSINPLTVRTISAGAEFLAPWQATGRCEDMNGHGLYSCNVRMLYTLKSEEGKTRQGYYDFVGNFTVNNEINLPPDNADISQWVAYPIANQVDGEVVEEWARNLKKQYTTLGELREYLK